MTLPVKQQIRHGHATLSKGIDDQFTLAGRHHGIVGALQHQQRTGETVDVIDGRTIVPALGMVGMRTQQPVVVARFKLVGLGSQHLKVSDAIGAHPGGKHIGGSQCRQRREPASRATANHHAGGVNLTGIGQPGGHGDAVGHVGNTPGLMQLVAVPTAVSRRPPVIHVHHGPATGGPKLDAHRQLAPGRSGGPAVNEHHQWRLPGTRLVGSNAFGEHVGVVGAVQQGMGQLVAGGGERDGLGL